MRPRSLARRLAFQYLFLHDLNQGDCESIDEFMQEHTDLDAVRTYADELVRCFRNHGAQIDEQLQSTAANYELNRIAAAERNVLRLAIAELKSGETPYRVVIDEAVNLAKQFGDKDSGRFVNGILDRIAHANLTDNRKGEVANQDEKGLS